MSTATVKKMDVVLDTDAFNEVDDQFAISYLLKNSDRLNTVALYAAPFLNENSVSPKDGMEKSYHELSHILTLAGREDLIPSTYRGSDAWLTDENTPILSDAARDLCERAMHYTKEAPLTVVAIGAITNIASALLLKPEIADRMKVVWLGGNDRGYTDTVEFNMLQDYAAARVVMSHATSFVQLPCRGVVHAFTLSKADLEAFLLGKNPLADYLAKNAIRAAESYAKGKPWTRVIWDVTAVAYLLNDGERFLRSRMTDTYLPAYDGHYEAEPIGKQMEYVYYVERDALMTDLFEKLV